MRGCCPNFFMLSLGLYLFSISDFRFSIGLDSLGNSQILLDPVGYRGG